MTATENAVPLNLDIRPATLSDGIAIIDMWMELQTMIDSIPPCVYGQADKDAQLKKLTNTFNSAIRMETALILVATLEDKPIGTISLYLVDRPMYDDPKSCILLSVWVHSDYRRLGIARKMFETGKQWAASQGTTSLQVGWHPGNPYADGFWKGLGFMGYELIGTRRIDD